MTYRLTDKHHAVLGTEKHGLVLGGPGSGKTTLALLKATKRINNGLGPGQSVLFLSFSRAAVARIEDSLKKDKSFVAARRHLSVQTFHSFFWELLRTHGHLLGAPKQLSIILAHEEKALRHGIEADDPGWDEWKQKRQQLFQEEGRVCFDLFAPLASDLLTRARRIRERCSSRFPLILVDEAQDTGAQQWSCVQLLSERSQVICLADLDQLIFGHLPGVGPERVDQIRSALEPLEIDLGDDNNRSPNTEIAIFGRDVLNGVVRPAQYRNVSRIRFSPKGSARDKTIRKSVGIISQVVKNSIGHAPESIGVFASYGSGVAIISGALRQDTVIPHQVLFDEAFVLLASRAGAYLLEPKMSAELHPQIAKMLDLLSDAFRAKGGTTALNEAAKLAAWAVKTRATAPPKVKLVKALTQILTSFGQTQCCGNPAADWARVKRELRNTNDATLAQVAGGLDYLIAFNRGQRIATSLSELWLQTSSYAGACKALDAALTQEQLISAGDGLHGIHVMNMHKSKGKQFDAVVLYRDQYNSPFVWKNDPAPHRESRKVLHVAITRARYHVLLVDEASSTCDIFKSYTL